MSHKGVRDVMAASDSVPCQKQRIYATSRVINGRRGGGLTNRATSGKKRMNTIKAVIYKRAWGTRRECHASTRMTDTPQAPKAYS